MINEIKEQLYTKKRGVITQTLLVSAMQDFGCHFMRHHSYDILKEFKRATSFDSSVLSFPEELMLFTLGFSIDETGRRPIKTKAYYRSVEDNKILNRSYIYRCWVRNTVEGVTDGVLQYSDELHPISELVFESNILDLNHNQHKVVPCDNQVMYSGIGSNWEGKQWVS